MYRKNWSVLRDKETGDVLLTKGGYNEDIFEFLGEFNSLNEARNYKASVK